MGRKRVLALGPALSRMRSISADHNNPYEKIINGGHDLQQQQQLLLLPGGAAAGSTTKTTMKWWPGYWKRNKPTKSKLKKLGNKKKKKQQQPGSGCRLRFKVSRLRIRLLISPLLLLKKLRDSYVRMMLALERNCGDYGTGALAMSCSSYPGIHTMYPFPISNSRNMTQAYV
ncbi:unnamed protein product [Sphagnum compactum]